MSKGSPFERLVEVRDFYSNLGNGYFYSRSESTAMLNAVRKTSCNAYHIPPPEGPVPAEQA